MSHSPAGASLKQLYHFGQLIRDHRFRQYDHGKSRNFEIYQRETPPDYDLKRCTTRVGIMYADADTMASPIDVKRLPTELPNVVEMRRVEDNTFNHIDFLWAQDAQELVYRHIVDWMRAEEKRHTQIN